MMIRIRWKLTMILLPGVFAVFAFHKKEGQGVTFPPPKTGGAIPVPLIGF